MKVQIAYLPAELASIDLAGRVAVAFDVVRATTTMIAALANGVREIRAFASLQEASTAHALFGDGPKLLAGERQALRPEGFDLGNSPGEFTRERVEGRTLFFATTNGTRAVRACATARQTFVASLCDASAMAERLAVIGADVVLVCAGVDGSPGGEDIDGAATVADVLQRRRNDVILSDRLASDVSTHSWVGLSLEAGSKRLKASPGGQNLARAGLLRDLEFVAVVDQFTMVGAVEHRSDCAIVRRG